ncbi:MAG: carboxypeptidase-like regulatory domain-containing protein [Flavobacterium sp.]
MKHFYLLIFCFLSVFTNAQTIKGIVVNADNGKPVEAASVFIDNTTIATETDAKGNFQINIPANNKNQLVVSAFGYEYFIVSNPKATADLKISLKSEDTILDELVIDKNVFTRKEMLKAFRHFFIGNTKNAKRTKIVNEKDLVFYYDTKTNQLSAHSDKPIIINNENLGYTINFHLDTFQVQFNYQTLNPQNYMNSNYFGYSLFNENGAPNKKTIANRTETYNNSSVSFFSDLTTSNLENSDYMLAVNGLGVDVEEYLKVESENDGYKLCIIKMPTRKRADLSGVVTKNITLKSKSPKDTTEIEVPFVVFNKETKEQSQLYFQQKCVLIQKSGHLVNPNDIYFSGVFGDLKTADMLPFDYTTELIKSKKKKQEKFTEISTYEIFEKEAIDFYTSKGYISHIKARKSFSDKLKVQYNDKVHEPFVLWIEDNLNNTSFSTKEEAINLHDNFVSTYKVIRYQKEDIEKKEDHFRKVYGEKKFDEMYSKTILGGILGKADFPKPDSNTME